MTDKPDFSDIDTLMAQDPMSLSTQDLDRIIAYQRKQRVQREAGVRTKKVSDKPATKIDITSLLSKPIVSSGGGIRRKF
jgi:hypothetical protein